MRCFSRAGPEPPDAPGVVEDGMADDVTTALPSQAKRRGSLVALAALMALVAGGGGAALWFELRPGAEPAEARSQPIAKRPEVGALLALDPFIANLADEDGKRYLKTTIQLEFFARRVPDDANARIPQIRDLLLTLFTSKLFSEIRTPEGKALLRDEVMNRVNRALRRDLVKAVYFTEFIVE
jgi:flagellar FliL protein